MAGKAVFDRSTLRKILPSVNEAMETQLVGMFIAELDKTTGPLDTALAAGDWEELFDCAHQIGGSCRNVGALALGATALKLEAIAQDVRKGRAEGDLKQAAAIVAEVGEQRATLMAELKRLGIYG